MSASGFGSPSVASNVEEGLQPYSCVLCKQRKVKCDRQSPTCSSCAKANVECIYRAPDPPRRRKRKLSATGLQARLKYCEELLEDHGIPVEDDLHHSTSNKSNNSEIQSPHSGKRNFGAARNARDHDEMQEINPKIKGNYGPSDIWNEIHELEPSSRQEREWLEDQDDSDSQSNHLGYSQLRHDADFFFGVSVKSNIRECLPSTENISRLWQIYKESVDPIMKFIHIPSVEKTISKAVENPDNLSKSEAALFTSILAAALNTLSESKCALLFGQDRQTMMEMLRRGARQALSNANFLGTSNFTVLQALVIFLMSMRGDYDHPSLFSMSGIAARLGMRMGLDTPDLEERCPPFEAEMKRRMWLQLVIFDAQLGELSGCPIKWSAVANNIRQPANLNDDDLYPEMKELPPEREGATDVMFSRMRYDVASLIKRLHLYSETPRSYEWSEEHKEEQDRIIQEMEDMYVNKYLRYCDPLVPMHFLVTLSGRAMISRLKLMAAHPRNYADRGASLPKEERDRLFELSLKCLEYETLANSTKIFEGFLWHVSLQIQYGALVYILSELRRRTSGAEVEKAWRQIEEVYTFHPELVEKGTRRFFWALGSLVLGTWLKRQAEHQQLYGEPLAMPEFIQKLQAQRANLAEKRRSSGLGSTPGAESVGTPSLSKFTVQANGMNSTPPRAPAPRTFGILPWGMQGDWASNDLSTTDFDPFGNSPLNWSEWDEMLRDCERLG